MDIRRVGILRGGTDHHYESSLKQGGDLIVAIAENLSHKWKSVDVLVDRDGVWHAGGVPISPAQLVQKVDVVWSTLPPAFSRVIEEFSIPHIGTSPFSVTLRNSRTMLRDHMQKLGINMPRHFLLPAYQDDIDGDPEVYAVKKAKEVFEKFGAPWILRAFPENPHLSPHVAKTYPDLSRAILELMSREHSILIEELIPGKVVQAHSLGGFRGEDVYTLPISGLSAEDKNRISVLARDMYNHFGAKFYLNSHFILHPKGKIYLSDVKFTPDLNKGSHFHESCEMVGSKLHHIVEHVLDRI